MKYKLKRPKVTSIEKTLNKVIEENCSMARFGDGEIFILLKKGGVGFQHYNEKLANRLKEVINYKGDNLLVCIHDCYYKINDDRTEEEKKYWKEHLKEYGLTFFSLIDTSKMYYNATCTRIYSIFKNKDKSKELFLLFKKIWENRDVIIVEGEKTRIGVGNDLLNNAKSIKRIIIPAEEAFSKYDEILDTVLKMNKKSLILISAGPTATVLAYDLSKNGYQAVDIGHIDIEYEWYKKGAKERVPVEGKYTNEANYREIEDIDYYNQILFKII